MGPRGLRLGVPFPDPRWIMIVLEGLTKHYGDLQALSDLSLEVRPGEIYALLGPNGAGKTTALRCLSTLLKPTAGTASVGGADVLQDPLRVKSRIGFLAASMGLYERLTARELVAYFGRLQGLDEARLEKRVDELAALFGLDDFRGRYCGRLSTGQRQRVALARAIVQDPPALILDEPTLGLDVLSGETIYRFMAEERNRGKAILFSTHQMAEVELLADRVGVLSRGRLVAEGTVEGLVTQTGARNLARAFLALVEAGGHRPMGKDFGRDPVGSGEGGGE
jgi:sodium transport system ATP-binding protein